MKKIPNDQIARLWGHLENQFKVAVQSIGTGLDENKQVCACVLIDGKGAPDVKTLPDTFEGENVRYTVSQARPRPL